MSAPNSARYSMSGTASRSPTKPGGGGSRRLTTLDTATSAGSRRPSSGELRPDGMWD